MDKKLLKLKTRQNEIYSGMSEILAGISSPIRLRIIHFLSQAPLSVETLSEKIDQSLANTSMHLRKMHAAQLVNVTIQGKKRVYSLTPSLFSFWEACQDFIQELDPHLSLELEDVYGEIDWQEDRKVTMKMIKNQDVLLVDVRPRDEASGELQELNVIQLPSSELQKGLSKLPKRKPVLVFCRGRFCALSAFVVNELRKEGIKAFRLNESWYSLKKMA